MRVFTLKSLSSRYRELPKRFIRAKVVLQVLLLNLRSFQKMLQVELSMKVVLKTSPSRKISQLTISSAFRMFSNVVFHLLGE